VSSIGYITPEWPVPAHVRSAFTLRTGGVSRAPFNALNTAQHVGDDPAAVQENRRRVREVLSVPAEPVWLEQVHGVGVADLDKGLPTGPADAAVTRTPGRVCVIQVADCMPVLFASQSGDVVGAAHAGWRGLAHGVLESTVRAMNVAPSQVVAWLGPAIDLYMLARQRLRALGVQHISGGGWCTYADADRFFSFRRERTCGRMAALIWISPPA
jgi:copper oxidase (laccase) domain-containing protein